jgi:hypothetical protein
MDHLRVLKRALYISWKYRALWLVGLLLVLAGGGVMRGGFGGGPPGGAGSGGPGGGGPYGGPGRTPDTSELWTTIVPILVGVALLITILAFVAIAIAIVSAIVRYVTRTSLIQMVQSYEETEESVGFWAGLRLGWSRSALNLFLINVVFRLPLALLIVLLILPLVGLGMTSLMSRSGPGIGLGVLSFLLIIPVALIGIAIRALLAPILEVMHRACVIEGLGVWESIREGWGLVRRNLTPTALQWLLLVGLGIGWRIVLIPINIALVFLAIVVGVLPAFLLGGLAASVAEWPLGLVVGMLVFIPTLILIIAVPNILLTTFATVYYSTAWTLTYREVVEIDERSAVAPEEPIDTE